MHELNACIDRLEKNINHYQKINAGVSASSVGWHIEHSLMVLIKITAALKQSDPENYRWKFNLARSYVYTFNKIPRGRGKAPKTVLPEGDITSDSLARTLIAARERVLVLQTLPAKAHFAHPYFGILNLKAAKKFLQLHTLHHLKIIDDIVT